MFKKSGKPDIIRRTRQMFCIPSRTLKMTNLLFMLAAGGSQEDADEMAEPATGRRYGGQGKIQNEL